MLHVRRQVCCIALIVGGLGAACSDSGDGDEALMTSTTEAPTTTTSIETTTSAAAITFAEWQRQTTLVCEEYEPQQDAIVAAHPALETPDDVVALFDELIPLADRYIAALAAVEVPAERSADVERTFALNTLNGQAASRARNAAAAGDQPGFRSAMGMIEDQSAELESLLNDLGVPACVSG